MNHYIPAHRAEQITKNLLSDLFSAWSFCFHGMMNFQRLQTKSFNVFNAPTMFS
jgi:hypothetical protein